MPRKADIITCNNGSLWSFTAQTLRGWKWLMANCEGAYDTRVLAEHRFGFDIACGAMRDGLRLQDANTGRFAKLPREATR